MSGSVSRFAYNYDYEQRTMEQDAYYGLERSRRRPPRESARRQKLSAKAEKIMLIAARVGGDLNLFGVQPIYDRRGYRTGLVVDLRPPLQMWWSPRKAFTVEPTNPPF